MKIVKKKFIEGTFLAHFLPSPSDGLNGSFRKEQPAREFLAGGMLMSCETFSSCSLLAVWVVSYQGILFYFFEPHNFSFASSLSWQKKSGSKREQQLQREWKEIFCFIIFLFCFFFCALCEKVKHNVSSVFLVCREIFLLFFVLTLTFRLSFFSTVGWAGEKKCSRENCYNDQEWNVKRR